MSYFTFFLLIHIFFCFFPSTYEHIYRLKNRIGVCVAAAKKYQFYMKFNSFNVNEFVSVCKIGKSNRLKCNKKVKVQNVKKV